MRIRTGYSFRAAAGKIERVAERLQEIGWQMAPMTDRASTFGWVKWSKLCKKQGLTPVFGVELAVTDSIHAKKPSVDFWTFIALDSIAPINRLVELATSQFRYQPLLTYDQALAAEGVARMAGHRSSVEELKRLHPEGLYYGLGPAVTRGYARQMDELGILPLMTSDNYYVRQENRGFWEVLCGRGASTQSYPQHILSLEEWRQAVRWSVSEEKAQQAVDNLNGLFSYPFKASLTTAQLLKPEKPKTLAQMCEEGAVTVGCDLTRPEYRARLDRELALIHEKDFEDYFYIVADITTFARQNMLVGPARGSSCGSLVCYLLGITTVDPIPHGLIFERFIDINRNDLPDIDIDFSDTHRQKVFDYITHKYGHDRVARLGTVAMFKPRSALQEASAALKIPRWKCDAVAESLIERSSGDSRALNTLEDTLATMPAGQKLIGDHPEIAVICDMEGHPRHYSQHAAGIVIAEKPIAEYVAVDHRTGATMCDKKDAEDLNLLKIDALGLTQLSVFEDCLTLAGLPRDFLESIPYDDQAAFDVLNQSRWSGIFQFNGMALQSITKQFKVTDFYDIVSVTALGRPGPLASGGAHEWIRRKNGINAVTFPHECFRPFLEDTLGIVLYQEQVMEIGRQIGDLSWEDVTALRKAMSKSLGKEYFDQFGDRWKTGAKAKGVDPERLDKIWDDLCAYGAWSFNKSHSVAYGIISYQCCYLKAHYPVEFAAATLTHEGDPARQIQLLREMADEGIEYIPVDKDQSTDRWAVGWRAGKKILVGPLQNVKGIGPKMVSQIASARARGEPMPERAAKLLEDPVTSIDSLFPIRDAFRRIMPDPAERNIITPPTKIVDAQPTTYDQEFLFFCTFSKINPRDENEAVIVARRGYRVTDGKTASLNLQCTDDTDTIFGKINRFKYEQLGRDIVNRGRPGKSLYAVKGRMRANTTFRMIEVNQVRYIGDIDG